MQPNPVRKQRRKRTSRTHDGRHPFVEVVALGTSGAIGRRIQSDVRQLLLNPLGGGCERLHGGVGRCHPLPSCPPATGSFLSRSLSLPLSTPKLPPTPHRSRPRCLPPSLRTFSFPCGPPLASSADAAAAASPAESGPAKEVNVDEDSIGVRLGVIR